MKRTRDKENKGGKIAVSKGECTVVGKAEKRIDLERVSR